jgi:hypothetical protein
MESHNLARGWVLVAFWEVACVARSPMDWNFARPVISVFVPSSNIAVALGCNVRHTDNVVIDAILPLHIIETDTM